MHEKRERDIKKIDRKIERERKNSKLENEFKIYFCIL